MPADVKNLRQCLERLGADSLLDRLMDEVGMPPARRPSPRLLHSQRCRDVLQWAESPHGCTLDVLDAALMKLAGQSDNAIPSQHAEQDTQKHEDADTAIPEQTSCPPRSETAAFLRDLRELLPENEGKWAAYRGDVRLGVDESKPKLCQACIAQGYKKNEFVVLRIQRGVYEDEQPALIRDV